MPQSARSSTKFNPAILVIIGAVALGLLVVAVGIGAVLAFKSRAVVPAVVGPSADAEGEEWTYKDLRDHLERKGMKYRIEHQRSGGIFFVDPTRDAVNANAFVTGKDPNADGYVSIDIQVYQSATAQGARETAGRHEQGAMSWGRFVIYGNEDTLNRIRAALR